MADLKTYEKINEEIKFTEEETVELLKLSEKEILVLILSELKKISKNSAKEFFLLFMYDNIYEIFFKKSD